MDDPKKDISKLQDEIDKEQAAVKKATATDLGSKGSFSGAVLGIAGGLVVLGLAFTYAQMLKEQTVMKITAGSIGGAAGLVVGYALGRYKRP